MSKENVIIEMKEETLKYVSRDYICYNRKWLLANLEQEFSLLRDYKKSNYDPDRAKKEFQKLRDELAIKGVID
ncbi:hypothetical protein [Eubacterium sp.]|uniref:hypothetical protein n=1 Tax=Eubacterium sp. TaxID=142586 RepID=UPI0025FD6406|nr:hypothetical protein [Eubacterium sp.]MCR5629916.1 hypothetical protein [Eubacterium sp.]